MRIVLLVLLTVACVRKAPAPPDAVTFTAPSASARSWFLRGRYAESIRDMDEAERAYQWMVREDGRRAEAHEMLAAFYERERRWEEAAKKWNDSLLRDPERWQAHGALARLAGRAGDEDTEVRSLSLAVERGASAAIHERLFDLQTRRGEPGAEATLDRWLTLTLSDPIDHMRRARAARAVDRHEAALDDLIHIANSGDRAADVAPQIVESAQASCRFQAAHTWARSALLDDPTVRRAVLELAQRVGDPSLMERARLPGSAPPMAAQHRPWRSPPLPLGADPDAQLVVAEAWRRASVPQRALQHLDGRNDGWSLLIRAYAHVALGDDQAAWTDVERIDAAHPAWVRGRVLGLSLGQVKASELQNQVSEAQEVHVAEAAAELYELPRLDVDNVSVRGLFMEQVQTPDTLLRVADSPSGALELAVRRRGIQTLLADGQRRAAVATARAWTESQPQSVPAWLALGQADPERADKWAARALAIEPCHAEALLLRARHARADEVLEWLRRAQQADPLSLPVHQALVQRGLEIAE
ncbi:MAG: hypothetical protein AB8H79_13565 [Myxococcota bacterium]